MTSIIYYGLSNYSFNAYGGELTFSSFIGSGSTTYVFQNADGQRVTMTGEDITVDGNGRFVSGTIEEITISPRGESEFEVDLRITDLDIDGTEILGSGGANVPSSDKAWQAVMEGDVDMSTEGDGRMDLAMDAPRLRDSDTLTGGDNSVEGDFAPTSYIMGSVAYVYDTATVVAGDFEFDGQARYVLGDVWNLYDSSVVLGGDDELTFNPGTDYPDLHSETSIIFSGDARGVRDTSRLVAGDDEIDMRLAGTSDTVYVMGDATYVHADATVIGGDDTIWGAKASENQLFGDVQTVSEGASVEAGDDVIYGGDLNDIIHGDFNETYTGSEGGDDTLYGGNGDDSLFGGAGDDLLFDAGGAGEIYGGDGDDHFTALANGAHTFNGGEGFDLIDYSKSDGRVVIDLEAQTATGNWANDDAFSDVEAARGSQRGDFLYGTDEDDVLYGSGGNDSLIGRGGEDSLYAGRGQDQIVGQDGATYNHGGQGFDVLDYRFSDDDIKINLANGKAEGGYAEGDTIRKIENIFGTGFDDIIKGDKKANFLRGREGDDVLKGAKGQDRLEGQKGDDEIFGGRGADKLKGGKGEDEIYGGKGNDVLRGGKGEDSFVFKRGDDFDHIRDFANNRDTLLLDGLGSNPLKNAQQVGDDVYIDFGRGDQLYIDDITIQQLRNDIEFA